jgi:lysozyme
MEAKLMDRIKEQLVRHEGLRLKPYRCTAGKLTIGVGRNLEDKGISQQEAYELLENDIRECEVQLLTEIPDIYLSLDIFALAK